MHALGAQGVPALLVKGQAGHRLLNGNVLYGSFDDLMAELDS
jgi:protein-disulfide isomerase-like protein with CxxC motif